MHGQTFKSKDEITIATVAVANLMKKWGLKNSDYMIGKYLSHFYCGAIKKPNEISKDINIYVLKNALPWKVNTKSRSLIPPAGELFNEYNKIQDKYGIGIDFIPIPGVFLNKTYVTKNKKIITIETNKINFESMEKFIKRIQINHKILFTKTKDEIKNFYFADKKRYLDRLKLYEKIKKYFIKNDDKFNNKNTTKIVLEFKKMMQYAYPELFLKVNIKNNTPMIGKSIGVGNKIIKGKVEIYSSTKKYKQNTKVIYVFSHFFPGDSKILSSAKAVITNGGGMLCHAAIVCRELKIPCIVGVSDATNKLSSGDYIEINNITGNIKKYEK